MQAGRCYTFHLLPLLLDTLPITAAAAPLCLSPRRLRACRQALESFSPRQLRLMFVLQPWEKKMNYGEQVGRAG